MAYLVYQGDEARAKLRHLLSKSDSGKPQYQLRDPEDRCCGYFLDGETWIAFDNFTHDCWVEEFRSEKQCRKYLEIT